MRMPVLGAGAAEALRCLCAERIAARRAAAEQRQLPGVVRRHPHAGRLSAGSDTPPPYAS